MPEPAPPYARAAATDLLEKAREVLGLDAGTLLQAQLLALAGRIAIGTDDLQIAAQNSVIAASLPDGMELLEDGFAMSAALLGSEVVG